MNAVSMRALALIHTAIRRRSVVSRWAWSPPRFSPWAQCKVAPRARRGACLVGMRARLKEAGVVGPHALFFGEWEGYACSHGLLMPSPLAFPCTPRMRGATLQRASGENPWGIPACATIPGTPPNGGVDSRQGLLISERIYGTAMNKFKKSAEFCLTDGRPRV